jgi:hypothetical protein
VEYIDWVEAPALHRCAKHCEQVEPLLQFEILTARSSNRRAGPAPLNPEQKGCREFISDSLGSSVEKCIFQECPDDDASAVPLDSGLVDRQHACPVRLYPASLTPGWINNPG